MWCSGWRRARKLRAPPEHALERTLSLAESWFEELDRAHLRALDEGDEAEVEEGPARPAWPTARTAGPEPTVEVVRREYSAEAQPAALCSFSTDWDEGRNPRRRIELLLAAGWLLVTRKVHIKWRRELPTGEAQVITFSTTPGGSRYWDHESAALCRADEYAVHAVRQGVAGWARSSR